MIACWQCRWLDVRIWWDEDGEPTAARCMHPDRKDLGQGEERCSCFEEDDKAAKGLNFC